MKLNFQSMAFLLFALFLGQNLLAETKMNEISADQYEDFKTSFNFVTVRYRKDSAEMRFVYANDLAFKTLKANETEYPDGSVFAKIGIASEEDPAFPSSAVPSGKRRIQFMVKDKNKYKDSQGWGYALFDWSGNTFPGDLKQVTQGCVACHQIAKERGYVFSQLIGDPFVKKIDYDAWKTTNKFKLVEVKSLPALLQKQFPKNAKQAWGLYGALSESSFFGTLDEIRPLLSQKAAESKLPSFLISKDKKNFSLVFENKTETCAKDEVSLASVHSVANLEKPLLKANFCFKNSK